MEVEWIDDISALGADWDALATCDPSPFSLNAWLVPWIRSFGGRRALRICVVRHGGELTAGVPLLRAPAGLEAAANEHSPSFRALARGPVALDRLAKALADAAGVLRLRAMPAREPIGRQLVEALGQASRRCVVEPDYVSPIADTRGSFEEYRNRMRPSWRELERRGRKLWREHAVSERLVEPPAELESELDEGLALEAAGWKGRERTAITSSPQTAQFYRRIARAFHERGELRLSSLRVDERLAAFDLALLHRGRYFLLKTAYDESLRTLAPGLVMRRAVVERCFALGLEAHEFLGGDMAWKRLFSTGVREHHAIRAYPSGAVGAPAWVWRARVRPWLQAAWRARDRW